MDEPFLLSELLWDSWRPCSQRASALRHNALLWIEPLRPARAQSELLGTLPRTEKTPLDLSIAKAQKGPWVFEVKYFKYTLFTRIPLRDKHPTATEVNTHAGRDMKADVDSRPRLSGRAKLGQVSAANSPEPPIRIPQRFPIEG